MLSLDCSFFLSAPQKTRIGVLLKKQDGFGVGVRIVSQDKVGINGQQLTLEAQPDTSVILAPLPLLAE